MVTILDGGMGRELKRIGAPFQQPEWSALALMQGPQFVRQAHDAFAHSGAQVLTTNSYAVVPFHIGQERFEAQGVALARLSAELARASADPPAVLRERVTSKGGTTHAALSALEHDQVAQAFERAMQAACARAKTLGDEFGR